MSVSGKSMDQQAFVFTQRLTCGLENQLLVQAHVIGANVIQSSVYYPGAAGLDNCQTIALFSHSPSHIHY